MKTLSLFAVAVATLFLGACDIDVGTRGSGHVVTVQQPIQAFSEVSGRGSLRIEWHSGPPSLSLTTDDNLTELFESKTVGNRLELRMRERVRPTHGIKVSVS